MTTIHQIEMERRAFETWQRTQNNSDRLNFHHASNEWGGIEYDDISIDYAWQGWLAAKDHTVQSAWNPIDNHGFEHGQDILITNGEEVWSDTVMCDIEGSDHVFYFDNGSDPDYITHWQPLPQPPKARE